MHRFRIFLTVILGLSLAVLAVPVSAKSLPKPAPLCFPKTSYCIKGRLLTFWEQNGGLPVFGYPITDSKQQVIEGQTLHVQWFERARLELHPENPYPYDVQLGRIGVEALLVQGRDWFTFSKSDPRPDCQYFAETGHNVCGLILNTWQSHGLELDGNPGYSKAESLALLGLPVSDEQPEKLSDGQTYTVQWFERGRIEIHPEHAGTPYETQLGLLGSEVWNAPKNVKSGATESNQNSVIVFPSKDQKLPASHKQKHK